MKHSNIFVIEVQSTANIVQHQMGLFRMDINIEFVRTSQVSGVACVKALYPGKFLE
jgi:hypothetical protein